MKVSGFLLRVTMKALTALQSGVGVFLKLEWKAEFILPIIRLFLVLM